MSRWPSANANRVLAALMRIGWTSKRQSGSHRTFQCDGWPDVVFGFHGRMEVGAATAAWMDEAA